jgi:diacylglycerol kinase family enzyme
VIVNRGGGAAEADLGDRLRAAFAVHSVEAEIVAVSPGELASVCAEAATAADVDALVVVGGDGSVGTAAGALAGTGRPLGVVPLGTLNHFARDAGLPLDLEGAVAAIAAARTRPVDLGEVNGRIFVNNSAIGLYPSIVRERESQQRRLGRSKRLAMLVASLRALWRFSRWRLTVNIAGRSAPVDTPLLFVGNNRYEMSLLTLGRRERLDGGELCLYAPLSRSRLGFVALALRALLGRLEQQRDFLSLAGIEEAEVRSRRAFLTVATDGEARPMPTPLRYRIRPGALVLIVPPEAAEL